MYTKRVLPDAAPTDDGASSPKEERDFEEALRRQLCTWKVMNDVPWSDEVGAGKLADILKILLPVGSVIAGGAVAACLYGRLEQADDIDVWVKDLSSFHATLSLLKQNGFSYDNEEDLARLAHNVNSIDYVNMVRGDMKITGQGATKIQVIKRVWAAGVGDVVRDFDLLHCRVALKWEGSAVRFYATEGAVQANKDKKIYCTGTQYPARMMKRIAKYMSRGFTLPDAVPGAGVMLYDLELPVVSPEVVHAAPTGDLWDNEEYRNDYMTMDPLSFKMKWSNV